MPRSRSAVLFLIALMTAAPVDAENAAAADGIGATVAMTPAASGTAAGRLDIGSAVFRDETVRTGPSGVLEIQFVDQTHLALGSSSAVTLDKFVYAGTDADTIVIGLTKGAFRFATGIASKKSYRIETPIAGIGVRGTRFSAYIGAGVLRVTLEEGGVDICPNGGGACIALDRPGQSVEMRSGGAATRIAEAFMPSLLCSRSSGASNLCIAYGSGETGPNRPEGGSGQTNSGTPAGTGGKNGSEGQGRGGTNGGKR